MLFRSQIAIWLELLHRVCTSVGGLGSFVALIIVMRQFALLRAQSEIVQKNVFASMDAQLYSRLDSFNRFVFEHSQEYDLLDLPFPQDEAPERRSKMHRMCELGYTFYEEIYSHHFRLKMLQTEEWEEWEQDMIHFFSKPYVSGYWKVVCQRYAMSYRTMVNEMLSKQNGK